MMYFRVKFGYEPDDFISVDETELSTAVRAQVTGRVGIFKEGTVAGNHIISIIPDFQRAMGLNRDYQLTGEDYRRLGPKKEEHLRFLMEIKTEVAKLKNGNQKQLQSGRDD
jgi:hypothetical protein